MLCANCCVSSPCIRSVCIDVHGEELEEFRTCCYAVLAEPVVWCAGCARPMIHFRASPVVEWPGIGNPSITQFQKPSCPGALSITV